jgi:pimeloyl-ACP methyl ester carboxylesterase
VPLLLTHGWPGYASIHSTRWSELDRGGHFAAIQAPDLLIKDVRAFFRGLR